MRINVKAVKDLIENEFDGKLSTFSREIGMDYSYINQIMNGHRLPDSKKACEGVIELCKRRLKFEKYIFF